MAKNSKDKLGSGLKALLANTTSKPKIAQGKPNVSDISGIAMIPISNIEANPFQPRTEFEEEKLLQLVASIKSYGLIQPITVRKLSDTAYQIISGERRYRASKLANLKEIPAYIREADDNLVLEMALVENIQRADLNALEVAITYQRLIDECEINHETLADRVGKKRSTVSNYIRLLKLPPSVQLALKNQALSMGHARAILSLNSQEQINHVSQKVIKEGLSVRATEALIKVLNSSDNEQDTPTPPQEIQPQSADQITVDNYRKLIMEEIGSKVSISRNTQGAGKIVISFNNNKELEDIIDYFE